MDDFLHKVFKLFQLKIKFAMVSLVATGFDFLLYGLFVLIIFPADGTPTTREEMIAITLCGAFCGMLINFFLQKRFVFDLKRKVSTAFILAICVSLGGIALNAGIVAWLSNFAWFLSSDFHKLLPKIIATGTVFLYNFYLKRLVFEGRVFEVD